jgi:hypothetical protein
MVKPSLDLIDIVCDDYPDKVASSCVCRSLGTTPIEFPFWNGVRASILHPTYHPTQPLHQVVEFTFTILQISSTWSSYHPYHVFPFLFPLRCIVMSFFGFDTKLPKDHALAKETRGIFENPDPFAEVARKAERLRNDDDDVCVCHFKDGHVSTWILTLPCQNRF